MCSMDLKYNNYAENVHKGLRYMLETAANADVTFAIDGQLLKAHKMILSMMSVYFKELFDSNPCPHPIFFMKDVNYQVMKDLLKFIYEGKVQIQGEYFQHFMDTAKALRVNGLTHEQQKKTNETSDTCDKSNVSHNTTNSNEHSPSKPSKRVLEHVKVLETNPLQTQTIQGNEQTAPAKDKESETKAIKRSKSDNSSHSDSFTDLNLRLDEIDETINLNGIFIEDAELLHPAADDSLTLDLGSDEEQDEDGNREVKEQEIFVPDFDNSFGMQGEARDPHQVLADRSLENKLQNGMPVTLEVCRFLGKKSNCLIGANINGYRYSCPPNRNRSKAAFTSMRCTFRQPNCNARVVLTAGGRIVFERPHIHEPTRNACNKPHDHQQRVYFILELAQWQATMQNGAPMRRANSSNN